MSYNNNSQRHGTGPIPARWLYCPRNGDHFISDRFLPFKTPLSARYASQMPPECQFEPEMVFSFAKMYKAKIGLWIDLTNTTRFYDRQDIESRGTIYKKLQCRGHGEAPTVEQTKCFIDLVDDFTSKQPLDLIGVHCTHGFNRTGFLIVAYLVEKLDCSVEAALMTFAKSRPPGIYKADYIKELFSRYEYDEEPTPAPEMPAWCNDVPDEDDEYYENQSAEYSGGASSSASSSSGRKRRYDDGGGGGASSSTSSLPSTLEDDDNDDEDAVISTNNSANSADETNGNDQKPRKKRRKEFLNLNATFMAGVPGVTLVTDQPRLGDLQDLVQEMCNWKKKGFPGCQPVSMDLKNMHFLQTKGYRVSWKADGTRYMMLIRKEGEIYFFDRDNSCFQVEGLRFPYRKDLQKHLTNTLIDGEMVIDKVNNLTVPRYLVYDVVKFQNIDLMKFPFFPERLQCIKIDIIEPRYEAMKRGMIDKQREPFSVRQKDFWDITQSRALLGPKFAKTLSHEPDGLIFQPSTTPYVPGPCDEVLKWKPANMNSVDFKLMISEESGMGILNKKIGFLYVGQLETPFARIKYKKHLKDMHSKIIECKFENNEWVFMRERTDKSFPNSYNTAVAVCESIQHPVTTDILLDFIDNYRYAKDVVSMPPPMAPVRKQH